MHAYIDEYVYVHICVCMYINTLITDIHVWMYILGMYVGRYTQVCMYACMHI